MNFLVPSSWERRKRNSLQKSTADFTWFTGTFSWQCKRAARHTCDLFCCAAQCGRESLAIRCESNAPTCEQKSYKCWPGPSAEMYQGFLLYKFWRILPGFSWRIFLGTFSHKNEEKRSGDKICEKIRRLKNKNPRKICSAKIRP